MKCYFCHKERNYIKDCFEKKNLKNYRKKLIERLLLPQKMKETQMMQMFLLL